MANIKKINDEDLNNVAGGLDLDKEHLDMLNELSTKMSAPAFHELVESLNGADPGTARALIEKPYMAQMGY
jgi:hypothetical protein